MNISTIISKLRTEWAGNISSPLHLQLAPEGATAPYGILRVGEVTKAEDALGENDWQATVTFISLTTSDSFCLPNLDNIVNTYDRKAVDGTYSMSLGSAVFDFDYAENLNLWQSESSFTLSWTTPA